MFYVIIAHGSNLHLRGLVCHHWCFPFIFFDTYSKVISHFLVFRILVQLFAFHNTYISDLHLRGLVWRHWCFPSIFFDTYSRVNSHFLVLHIHIRLFVVHIIYILKLHSRVLTCHRIFFPSNFLVAFVFHTRVDITSHFLVLHAPIYFFFGRPFIVTINCNMVTLPFQCLVFAPRFQLCLSSYCKLCPIDWNPLFLCQDTHTKPQAKFRYFLLVNK